MVKSQIYIGMQEYLHDELAKCKVNTKISTIPISVSVKKNEKKKFFILFKLFILFLV